MSLSWLLAYLLGEETQMFQSPTVDDKRLEVQRFENAGSWQLAAERHHAQD